ncbi:hypothetical protein Tco_0321839 [Tanacetum coccineum]
MLGQNKCCIALAKMKIKEPWPAFDRTLVYWQGNLAWIVVVLLCGLCYFNRANPSSSNHCKRTHEDIQATSPTCDMGIARNVSRCAVTVGTTSTGRRVGYACAVTMNNGEFPVLFIMKTPGMPLTSLKELATDDDVVAFVKDGYDHGNEVELYTEHSGYNVLEMINNELNEDASIHKSSSDLDSSDDDYDPLDDLTDLVDFQTEGDDNLDIPKITTDDPWLNKLVGKGNFIGYTENPKPLDGRFILEEDDPDEHLVDQKFKVQKNGISYPSFEPNTLWDQCTPVLGMKFETPFKLLVKCGRDVSKGKCAGMKGKKPNPKPSVEEPKVGESSKKGKKGVYSEKTDKGESNKKSKNGKSSEKIKEKWTKQKIIEANRLKGQVDCPFRLWASWMSTERSF